MTESDGDETAVHLVLTHFENDFAHEWAIAHGAGYGQGTI
jgi:hypothetical protein